MGRIVNWYRGLSVRLQVVLGVALGVNFATLAFALLITFEAQQSIRPSSQERLRQTQEMAAGLDALLRRSGNPVGDISALLSISSTSPAVISTVIDNHGNVIASSSGKAATGVERHFPLLEDLVTEHRAGVRVHQASGGSHIVAYSPLESVGGGIIVDEQQEAVFLVPVKVLRVLPLFGMGVLLVATVSAWLHARYVVHPLRQLDQAAARIAGGVLDEPVTTTRRDEIGRLAQSFETMRSQLQAAKDARLWWEQTLEKRIRERTAEVNRLVGRVIHAQEQERRRLAQELHDDTAQAVASLLMGIEALRDSLPTEQERLRQHIDRTITQGHQALRDLRRVILGLRPAAVDDLGLVAALRSYTRARLEPSGVHLDFTTQGVERKLPEPVEAALFRILQEAVNNIAKHARAQHARIVFDFHNAHLVATVEDDGQGFDPSQVSASGRGVGLEGMRERAEVISAQLEVTSAPGKGTKVKAEVSLEDVTRE